MKHKLWTVKPVDDWFLKLRAILKWCFSFLWCRSWYACCIVRSVRAFGNATLMSQLHKNCVVLIYHLLLVFSRFLWSKHYFGILFVFSINLLCSGRISQYFYNCLQMCKNFLINWSIIIFTREILPCSFRWHSKTRTFFLKCK